MIEYIIRFASLLLVSLLVGSMFGIWLARNPSSLTAAAYVEQQQNMIRALNTVLPALGAACIMLTLVLALLTDGNPRSRHLLAAAALCLAASGLVTRFANQPINRVVMTWDTQSPAADWTSLRDRWWHWHVLRTLAGLCALSCTIAAAIRA